MNAMRVAANGVEIHCRVDGPEGAPWVTFSNSIAAALGLWDAQVTALADRYRILRYDLRGHGETEATPPPYDFASLAADVVALWDALAIERSHFVGLSLGGMIGAGLALDHRHRLLSLVVANSRLKATPDYVQSWDQRIAFAREKGMGALVDSTIDRWLTPDFIAAQPKVVERVKRMVRGCSLDGFEGAARALQKLDYVSRLSTIACPVLFIAGREDGACPSEDIRSYAAQIPGATYAELSPAAHLSNLEQPEAFNRALGMFLTRHDG